MASRPHQPLKKRHERRVDEFLNQTKISLQKSAVVLTHKHRELIGHELIKRRYLRRLCNGGRTRARLHIEILGEAYTTYPPSDSLEKTTNQSRVHYA